MIGCSIEKKEKKRQEKQTWQESNSFNDNTTVRASLLAFLFVSRADVNSDAITIYRSEAALVTSKTALALRSVRCVPLFVVTQLSLKEEVVQKIFKQGAQ